jgi:hypothetical protein
MYLEAIKFAKQVYDILVEKRGEGNFDFEMSIDETEAPTVLSIICSSFMIDLKRRCCRISAPRFIGEFQKAIDYIGDLNEFETQFMCIVKLRRLRQL